VNASQVVALLVAMVLMHESSREVWSAIKIATKDSKKWLKSIVLQ